MAYEHRRAGWVTSAALALGVAFVLMTACTDAKLVRLDAANTVVTIEASQQTIGFEVADWGIISILVQYTDPEAREANGGAPFTLLTDTVAVSLLGETRQVDGPSLRPGEFEIIAMEIQGPTLVNEDYASIFDETAECSEKVGLFASCIVGAGANRYVLDLGALPELPRFRVESGSASEIRILVDSDELIRAYIGAIDSCVDVEFGSCLNNTPPCVRRVEVIRDLPAPPGTGEILEESGACVSNFQPDDFELNAVSAIQFQ